MGLDASERDLLEQLIQQVGRLNGGFTSLREEVVTLRKEMADEFVAVRVEMENLEDRLRGEMHNIRDELRGEMHNIRDELRGEMHSIRDELRGEMHSIRDELRGEMHNIRDELRSDVQAVQTELREGMKEVRGEIAGLRRDVSMIAGHFEGCRRSYDEHLDRQLLVLKHELRQEMLDRHEHLKERVVALEEDLAARR